MLIGGVLVAHGNQAVHSAVAGFLAAIHGGHGQECVVHLQGVLNSGAVVGFQSGVVLLEVILEQRHRLAENHGIAGLAHDHTLAGFHAVVGHITGLGHFLNGFQQGEHILGGESVLQVGGKGIAQACTGAEDVQHIGSGNAQVCKHEAIGAVLGALLDDIQELLVGPAFLLNLGNVNAQLFHHGLVGTDGLNGQVQGQAVGGAFQRQILQSRLVVVSQAAIFHVLCDVNGNTHFYESTQCIRGNFSDVGCLTGLCHGGHLVVVVAPGSFDDFHGEVGMQGMEIVSPGFQVGQIIAGDRGCHDDNLVFRSRGLCADAHGEQAQNHHAGQQQCDELLH